MNTTSSVHRLIRVKTSSQFLQISCLHFIPWVHPYHLYMALQVGLLWTTHNNNNKKETRHDKRFKTTNQQHKHPLQKGPSSQISKNRTTRTQTTTQRGHTHQDTQIKTTERTEARSTYTPPARRPSVNPETPDNDRESPSKTTTHAQKD